MNHSFLNTTVKMVLNPLYRLQKLLNPLYRLQNKLTSFLWITVHRPLLCYLLCIIIKNIKMQDVECILFDILIMVVPPASAALVPV